MVAILGPTASGKTALAARLAYEICGEVISADSRQVYRRMDIGTGKDLGDYMVEGTVVPHHLIDIAEPGYEYNIYEYQRDFLDAYRMITGIGRIPVLCGGSGMYLEAVLKGYRLTKAEEDHALSDVLRDKTDAELVSMLMSCKTLHNTTDLEDRPRILKAILVARAQDDNGYTGASRGAAGDKPPFPAIRSVIFGVAFPRDLVMRRITERLENRLETGMIGEVEALLAEGIPPARLIRYGLEYRYITLFLQGKLSRSEMFFSLNIAIRQFAKRQMTWFRRMERRGMKINWLDGNLPDVKKIEMIRNFAGI